MNSNELIYPMFALAFLSASILILIAYYRSKAVKAGIIELNYLEKGDAEKAPETIVKLTHNLSNLFEFPVLFYVVVCVIIATDSIDQVYVWLSWVYVIIRYVHSVIHITYNYVPHRATIHLLGSLVLVALWVRLLVGSV